MVSVIPSERTPWDVIGQSIGANLSQTLPQAAQRAGERQMGLNAIDQLQETLKSARGDINKTLPALAKALTLNQNLERSGLAQTYLNRTLAGNALGQNRQDNVNPQQTNNVSPQIQQPSQEPLPYKGAPSSKQPLFATPSAFNLMTNQDIDKYSTDYAIALGDPNAKAQKQAELQNLNNIASEQRETLQNMALASDISPKDLPRFMQVGSQFDPRNPTEWMQNTKRAFQKLQSNDKKIERAFIPGLGSGLIGSNRDEALERLVQSSQDIKKLGLESELREYYADQYMSPTEIERQFYPTPKSVQESIKLFPKGPFLREDEDMSIAKKGLYPSLNKKKGESYLDMRINNPEKIQEMQNNLSEFFKNNINEDTSLLDVTEKLWSEKDYDWRQMGPAIRQAIDEGLVLNQRQSTELTDVETQPPKQSLPNIFENFFERIIPYLRGNR